MWLLLFSFPLVQCRKFVLLVSCTHTQTHQIPFAKTVNCLKWMVRECMLVKRNKIRRRRRSENNFSKLKGFAILFALIRIECHSQFSKKKENITQETKITELFFQRKKKISWTLQAVFVWLFQEFSIGRAFCTKWKRTIADNWKNGRISARCFC